MYITGNFEDRMDVGVYRNGGFITLESEGEDDVFVIRYDNGGALLRTLSGDDDATGRDIVVDDRGNVVAREIQGKLDFDPDLDDIRESKGDEDVFVAKYNDAADQMWAATFGGLEEMNARPSASTAWAMFTLRAISSPRRRSKRALWRRRWSVTARRISSCLS